MVSDYRYPKATIVWCGSGIENASHNGIFSGEDNLCLFTEEGSTHILFT